MATGTDVGAAGQGASAGGEGQPGFLSSILKIFGDPKNMQALADIQGKFGGLAGAIHKAPPGAQEMLDKHVQDQINKMIHAQAPPPSKTPYLGDIPPEVAIQILRSMGVPAETSPTFNLYSPSRGR